MADGWVAYTIVGKNQMHLYPDVLKNKKLIEVKRQQLILKTKINESKRRTAEAGINERKPV